MHKLKFFKTIFICFLAGILILFSIGNVYCTEYKLDSKGYLCKIDGKKIDKTSQKFRKTTVTDSKWILALGYDNFLYSIDKRNLSVTKISTAKIPNIKN